LRTGTGERAHDHRSPDAEKSLPGDCQNLKKGATGRLLLPNPGVIRITVVDPTGEVPYHLVQQFWKSADRELADDPSWGERAGAFSIESLGVQLYRGILLRRSPGEFLTQSVSLFQLCYRPGDGDAFCNWEPRWR